MLVNCQITVTMKIGADVDGSVTVAGDARVTRVGRLLRNLKIDELPQLLNVVKGDMSLVGPRPPLPEEVARYRAHHFARLAVLPGITCGTAFQEVDSSGNSIVRRNEIRYDFVRLEGSIFHRAPQHRLLRRDPSICLAYLSQATVVRRVELSIMLR